jgi:hypothetical protein
MKITKSQLKEIIKEEVSRLQKKTILENRKKEIVRELRMLNEWSEEESDEHDVLASQMELEPQIFYLEEDGLINGDIKIHVFEGERYWTRNAKSIHTETISNFPLEAGEYEIEGSDAYYDKAYIIYGGPLIKGESDYLYNLLPSSIKSSLKDKVFHIDNEIVVSMSKLRNVTDEVVFPNSNQPPKYR